MRKTLTFEPTKQHMCPANIMCQRAIWECQKIVGNWTPNNGGHKILRDSFSNFSATDIFPIKSKPGPTEFHKKVLQIGSCEKVFCPRSTGGIFYNQKQKKTEVTKMAFSTRRQRLRRSQKWRFSCPNTGFHKVAKQTKMTIFCKRAFWGLIQNLRVRFAPFGSLTRSAPAKTCEKILFWRNPFWGLFKNLRTRFYTIGLQFSGAPSLWQKQRRSHKPSLYKFVIQHKWAFY